MRKSADLANRDNVHFPLPPPRRRKSIPGGSTPRGRKESSWRGLTAQLPWIGATSTHARRKWPHLGSRRESRNCRCVCDGVFCGDLSWQCSGKRVTKERWHAWLARMQEGRTWWTSPMPSHGLEPISPIAAFSLIPLIQIKNSFQLEVATMHRIIKVWANQSLRRCAFCLCLCLYFLLLCLYHWVGHAFDVHYVKEIHF